jgi:Pentapeptide repeats (8 copies)
VANEEHLPRLKEGVAAWNAWRNAYPEIRPDLYEAELGGMDLREVNLRRADLKGADLSDARLAGADIRGADFSGAELSGANLTDAALIRANPTKAKMAWTILGLLRTFGERRMMARLITRRWLVSPLINKDFPVHHPLLAHGNVAPVHLNHQKCARTEWH